MTAPELTRTGSRALPPLRTAALPLLATALALAAAFAGAILTGTPASGVNAQIEGLSSSSSGLLGNVSDLFPLGFAFGAGMVSAANPCGFSLLPAYLGLFLGDRERAPGPARLRRALVVGGSVTAGFVVLFALVGVSIGSGAHFLVTSFPWIGFAVGVGAVLAGASMLQGGGIYNRLGERLAARLGGGTEANLRSYVLFGLSYGAASLSCTLPVFLTVVGSSIAVSDLLPSLGQFLLYALGMGTVITALTVSIALFRSALVGQLRRVLPYVQPLSAGLLLVAGSYIVYYWLTLGGLLDEIG